MNRPQQGARDRRVRIGVATGHRRFDDPVFDIRWPYEATEVSDQDRRWPLVDRP